MSCPQRNGKYLIQVTLSKESYEIIKKEANRMDMSVNAALREIALKALKEK